ncbi:MAG TPA: antitoxin Xre-like helix-turn-helix domain-containing protein [Candidatus Binatus sp.]|nr:antitoxin Xre-like helix-turn-helix domain-containing protein [Candidatus Binatus sp.]
MALLAPTQPQIQRTPAPAALLPTVFRILNAWKLRDVEQQRLLGLDSASTLYEWRRHAPSRLQQQTLERISYILWVYEYLHALFGEGPAADEWLRRPNTAALFAGKPPAEVFCSGLFGDVFRVYDYLYGQTQGWQ